MKFLVVLSSLLACSLGQQIQVYSSPYLGSSYPYLGSPYPYLGSPYPYLGAPVVSAPIVAPVSSQFRAQDELGQFTFATSGDNQARVETGALDGSVLGAYSYVDPTGKAVRVHYQADDGGFRVIGANNLPEAVAAPEVAPLKGPEPVQDTPEVVAARAEFQKKYDEAASAAEKSPDTPVSRRRRQILLAAPQVLSVAPAVAKATVKVHQYEPVDAAVPADTNKIELKEREHEVLVPAPVAYAAPQVVSVAHAPQVISVVPAGPQVLSIAPAVAKATVKVHQYEPVDAAVPADTNKIELKEREHEVLVPAPVSLPLPLVHHAGGLVIG